MKYITIRVIGKVQGVFYRATTKDVAVDLGIKGTVRNEQDGSVFIEAEGDDEVLKKFVEWCKQGPRHAQVDKVEIGNGPIKGFNDFKIKR